MALYQKETGVTHYGKVLRTELLKGKYLPFKVDNPHEEYYHFIVEQWLPVDIKPKQIGIHSVMYANLFLLQNSKELPELRFKSEQEYRLYMEMKRYSQEVEIKETLETETIGIDLIVSGQTIQLDHQDDKFTLQLDNETLTIDMKKSHWNEFANTDNLSMHFR